jgi:hypothetical protein
MIPDLTPSEIARFHSKILRGDGCWPWQGETNNKGYGRFTMWREASNKRVRILAHRLAYCLATGEDPGQAVIRHRCDNPPCCNPADLHTGTQADNMRDAAKRGRVNAEGLSAYRRDRDAKAVARLQTNKKRCSRCKAVKALGDFYRATANVDGRAYWCKACMLEHRRERRKLRKDAAA